MCADLHVWILDNLCIPMLKCSHTSLFACLGICMPGCLDMSMSVYLYASLSAYVLLYVYLHICRYLGMRVLVPYN